MENSWQLCGERVGERRSIVHQASGWNWGSYLDAARFECWLSVCLWESHLTFVGFIYLICKVGDAMVIVYQPHRENPMRWCSDGRCCHCLGSPGSIPRLPIGVRGRLSRAHFHSTLALQGSLPHPASSDTRALSGLDTSDKKRCPGSSLVV